MYDDLVILTMFQHLFGEDFIENPSLREAFTQNKDVNRPIAIIGDSFLNLRARKCGEKIADVSGWVVESILNEEHPETAP